MHEVFFRSFAMVAQEAYSVGVEDQQIVVRLKSGMFDRESVVRFLDFLELESIRRRSQMTPAEAAALAKEIDQSVWSAANRSGA
jgi:hypothetical protein